MDKLFTNLKVKAVEGETPEAPYGSFETVLSVAVEDRDGEVIDPGAFNPLPKSIPILADHDGQVAKLVARAEPYYDGDVLKARGYFGSHPLAQYVRGLIMEGLLDTMSVGFMNAKRTVKEGGKHITGGELLEASFVVIPANRDALVSAAKAFDAIDSGAKIYTDVVPMAGSYEDHSAAIILVLREVYPEAYISLVATYPDRVVFNVMDYNDGTAANYEAPYSLDDDGLVTLGEVVSVDIVQVVSPKALARFTAKAGRRNSSKDQANIQDAHDSLVLAGATCEADNTEEPVDEEAGKGLAGFDSKGLQSLADVVEMELDLATDGIPSARV